MTVKERDRMTNNRHEHPVRIPCGECFGAGSVLEALIVPKGIRAWLIPVVCQPCKGTGWR